MVSKLVGLDLMFGNGCRLELVVDFVKKSVTNTVTQTETIVGMICWRSTLEDRSREI